MRLSHICWSSIVFVFNCNLYFSNNSLILSSRVRYCTLCKINNGFCIWDVCWCRVMVSCNSFSDMCVWCRKISSFVMCVLCNKRIAQYDALSFWHLSICICFWYMFMVISCCFVLFRVVLLSQTKTKTDQFFPSTRNLLGGVLYIDKNLIEYHFFHIWYLFLFFRIAFHLMIH